MSGYVYLTQTHDTPGVDLRRSNKHKLFSHPVVVAVCCAISNDDTFKEIKKTLNAQYSTIERNCGRVSYSDGNVNDMMQTLVAIITTIPITTDCDEGKHVHDGDGDDGVVHDVHPCISRPHICPATRRVDDLEGRILNLELGTHHSTDTETLQIDNTRRYISKGAPLDGDSISEYYSNMVSEMGATNVLPINQFKNMLIVEGV